VSAVNFSFNRVYDTIASNQVVLQGFRRDSFFCWDQNLNSGMGERVKWLKNRMQFGFLNENKECYRLWYPAASMQLLEKHRFKSSCFLNGKLLDIL